MSVARKIPFAICLLLFLIGLKAHARSVYTDTPLGGQISVSDTVPSNDGRLRYHLRFDNAHPETQGPDTVSCVLAMSYGGVVIEWITVPRPKFESDIIPRPSCRIFMHKNGIMTGLKSFQPRKNRSGDDALSIRFTSGDGRLNMEIGSESDNAEKFSLDMPGLEDGCVINCRFSCPKDILRRQLVYNEPDDLGTIDEKSLTSGSCADRPFSAFKEAVWVYLDRDTDDSRCRLGGNYRLKTVSDGKKGYYIVYLGGAVKNPSLWKYGKVKGHLLYNGFDGQYDLKWLDPFGFLVSGECYGEIDPAGNYLTLSFPELNSKIRFRRAIGRTEE